MSPQSELWQLTGGDCQQSRNASGWKERSFMKLRFTLISELANLFSHSPFTKGKTILKFVNRCIGLCDNPINFTPSGRARLHLTNTPLLVSASYSSTKWTSLMCLLVNLLTQTHFRLAVSSNSPITVAVSIYSCNENRSPALKQYILFLDAKESSFSGSQTTFWHKTYMHRHIPMCWNPPKFAHLSLKPHEVIGKKASGAKQGILLKV